MSESYFWDKNLILHTIKGTSQRKRALGKINEQLMQTSSQNTNKKEKAQCLSSPMLFGVCLGFRTRRVKEENKRLSNKLPFPYLNVENGSKLGEMFVHRNEKGRV